VSIETVPEKSRRNRLTSVIYGGDKTRALHTHHLLPRERGNCSAITAATTASVMSNYLSPFVKRSNEFKELLLLLLRTPNAVRVHGTTRKVRDAALKKSRSRST
jgi:hypothetical protein